MLLLLLNHHFYCCLITTFTDLAAESPLHRNLDNFLTILRIDFRFQEQESIRSVSSNFEPDSTFRIQKLNSNRQDSDRVLDSS